MAPRPDIYPLPTPRNIAFPSEIQEYIRATNPEPKPGNGKGPSVPPPLAYTEFLKALSPSFGSPDSASSASSGWTYRKQLPSPVSLPSTASTIAFPGEVTRSRTKSLPGSPLPVPQSADEPRRLRRLRMSPTYLYLSATDSPRSAQPVRSPYPAVERIRYVDSPASAGGRSITIQHVITHTVTLKRVPSLAPPPKGKRRRMSQSQTK